MLSQVNDKFCMFISWKSGVFQYENLCILFIFIHHLKVCFNIFILTWWFITHVRPFVEAPTAVVAVVLVCLQMSARGCVQVQDCACTTFHILFIYSVRADENVVSNILLCVWHVSYASLFVLLLLLFCLSFFIICERVGGCVFVFLTI